MKNLKMYIFSALGAALIAVLAQLTIPFPIVPNTAQTLGITLVSVILGKKYGALSVFFYVLLGAIGLPVFAGLSGGFGIILGPTGGYILGFTVAGFLIGLTTEFFHEHYWATAISAALILVIFILVPGMVQLKFVANMSWPGAFAVGILPFIITAPVQGLFGGFIGLRIKKTLVKAHLLNI